MKTILIAVNSKYIHSSPAVYSLKAYAGRYLAPESLEIKEYTIHQPEDMVYYDLVSARPDVLAFSCYLWNIEYVRRLLEDLRCALPEALIVLGGPEASYGVPEDILPSRLYDVVIAGEGERAFTGLLLEVYAKISRQSSIDAVKAQTPSGKFVPQIPAKWQYRHQARTVSAAPICDLQELPFLYEDASFLKDRILYYESSRGCPFSCAYCLSAAEKGLRELPAERVIHDLSSLVRQKVRQVKFLDRTFNAHPARTKQILRYLISLPEECTTNFHFEAEADLFDDEMLDLIGQAPRGRIQLEIGIQSTFGPALDACGRNPRTDRILENCRRLLKNNNVRLHVDLIAGLPLETKERFEQSFNEVCLLHAHECQLGFLKLLRGSPMEKLVQPYGYEFSPHPPYEIIRSRSIGPEELYELKKVEDALGKFYNSCHFRKTLELLETWFESPYAMFLFLAEELKAENLLFVPAGLPELFAFFLKKKEALVSYAFTHGQKGSLAEEFSLALLQDFFADSASDKVPEGLEDFTRLHPDPSEDALLRRNLSRSLLKKASRQHLGREAGRTSLMVRFTAGSHPRAYLMDYTAKDPVTSRYDLLFSAQIPF